MPLMYVNFFQYLIKSKNYDKQMGDVCTNINVCSNKIDGHLLGNIVRLHES